MRVHYPHERPDQTVPAPQAESSSEALEVPELEHGGRQASHALEHLGRRHGPDAAEHLRAVVDVHRGEHDGEAASLLLKRRLDERGAPVRIEKTGRGRFRIGVAGAMRLEQADDAR